MCFSKKKLKPELINLIKETFVSFALLVLFTELVLSIYGISVTGRSEVLFGGVSGWLVIDSVMLIINLAIIGLMVERLIKSNCHVCKSLTICIICIVAIAIVAEILFISYDASTNIASDNDDIFFKNPSHIFNGAFGLECAIVAPVGLMSLITSIKVIKQYITK